MSTNIEPQYHPQAGKDQEESLAPTFDPFIVGLLGLANKCSAEAVNSYPALGKTDFFLDGTDQNLLLVTAMIGEARYYGRRDAPKTDLVQSLAWLKQAQSLTETFSHPDVGSEQTAADAVADTITDVRRNLRKFFVGHESIHTEFAFNDSLLGIRKDLSNMRPAMHFWGELIFQYYEHKTDSRFTVYPPTDQALQNQSLLRPDMVEVVNQVRELYAATSPAQE
jgi:hypothetical protein